MINLSEIFAHYNEPHRFYHNQNHILRMLGTFQKDLNDDLYVIRPTKNFEKIIIEAILFHDVIYDVLPNAVHTNEERSALFYNVAKWGTDYISINDHTTRMVSEMILATQYHFAETNPLIDVYVDEFYRAMFRILLDLDLQSFYDDYDAFFVTNENINKEYLTEFSTEAVLAGRIKFLETVKDSSALNFSSYWDAEWRAKKARENIDTYLNHLYKLRKEN